MLTAINVQKGSVLSTVSLGFYFQHLNGEVHESCLRELPYNIRDSVCLYEIMKAAFNMLTEVLSSLLKF